MYRWMGRAELLLERHIARKPPCHEELVVLYVEGSDVAPAFLAGYDISYTRVHCAQLLHPDGSLPA